MVLCVFEANLSNNPLSDVTQQNYCMQDQNEWTRCRTQLAWRIMIYQGRQESKKNFKQFASLPPSTETVL